MASMLTTGACLPACNSMSISQRASGPEYCGSWINSTDCILCVGGVAVKARQGKAPGAWSRLGQGAVALAGGARKRSPEGACVRCSSTCGSMVCTNV